MTLSVYPLHYRLEIPASFPPRRAFVLVSDASEKHPRAREDEEMTTLTRRETIVICSWKIGGVTSPSSDDVLSLRGRGVMLLVFW